MQNEKNRILARTPKIKPDESFRGYFLRLAEENGYDSQLRIFQMAGFDLRYPTSPTIENTRKVENLLGRSDPRLTYNCNRREKKSTRYIMGVCIDRFALTRKVMLCPECITEHGYIPAFCDFDPIDYCPHHHRWLISDCPFCKKPIPWLRPGLLQCSCGASLTHAHKPKPQPSSAYIDKMKKLWQMIYPNEKSIRNEDIPRIRHQPGFSFLHLAGILNPKIKHLVRIPSSQAMP